MSQTTDLGDGWNEGYAAALRDAVEAVKAIHKPDDHYPDYCAGCMCYGEPYSEYPCATVLAIEAVGEEQ